MKKILICLLFVPLYVFADDVEVNGQFVVAPISSENCEASAVTTPTAGLYSDSKLLEIVTPFFNSDYTASGIDYVFEEESILNDIVGIYSLNGQKQKELKRGINIVVDSQGQVRKILVK